MKLEQKILQVKRSRDSEWHRPRVGVYHASQLYDIYKGTLKPQNFFKKQNFDDKTLMTFEIGTMYHDYIQKFYKEVYPETEIEKPITIQEDGLKIVGRIDLLREVPIDLKTCSALPKVYYPSHEVQLLAYQRATGKAYGYLTYIEKNPRVFITKDFKIEFNQKLWDAVIQKVKSFHTELTKVAELKNN